MGVELEICQDAAGAFWWWSCALLLCVWFWGCFTRAAPRVGGVLDEWGRCFLMGELDRSLYSSVHLPKPTGCNRHQRLRWIVLGA